MHPVSFSYGLAVHGLLPFINAYGSAFEARKAKQPTLRWEMPDRVRLRKTMKKVLRDYAHIPEQQLNSATPRDWVDIWRCWEYLLDIIEEAELTSIEPLFLHSGKRPDLVCWHKGRVYVIEVKTLMKSTLELAEMSPRSKKNLMEQVSGTRDCLLSEPRAKGHEVLVYALFFSVGVSSPAEPVWLEIGCL